MKMVVIPMMVFVRTDEKERLELIRNMSSVTGCLFDRSAGQPAIIPDEEMERFKFMLDFSDEAVHFLDRALAPGDKIRV